MCVLRLAICDDNKQFLGNLKEMIEQILESEVAVSTHTNPFSLLTYIIDDVAGKLDVVILNVRIKDQDGVHVARTILNQFSHIKIIFITEQLELVKGIFRVTPIYFLIKPIEQVYLKDALHKTIAEISEDKEKVLIVKTGNNKTKLQSFKIKDIYYIESDMRQLHIHERASYTSIYMKMDELEKELTNNFLRCHQSYAVNMDKICKIDREEIVLFNNAHIPISRSKRKEVEEKTNHYWSVND